MPGRNKLESLQNRVQTAIRHYYGFVPAFFLVVQNTPDLLEKCWQKTQEVYRSPLPLLFQEKLFAALSTRTQTTLCMGYHAIRLHHLGMSTPAIIALLSTPLLSDQHVREQIRYLEKEPAPLQSWPQPGSALEHALLECACALTLHPNMSISSSIELRRLLSVDAYSALLDWMFYIRNCHSWIKSTGAAVVHDIAHELRIPLHNILTDDPDLAYFISFSLVGSEATRPALAPASPSLEQRALNTIQVIADAFIEAPSAYPSPTSRQNTIEGIVGLIGNFLHSRCGGLLLLESNPASILPVALFGLTEQQERLLRSHLADFEGSRKPIDDITISRMLKGEHISIDLRKQDSPWLAEFFLAAGVIQLHITPLSYGNEQIIGFLCFGFEQEAELPQGNLALTTIAAKLILIMRGQELLQRELEQLSKSERHLIEAQQRVDEFISIANHEMREPLTILKVTLQRLEQLLQKALAQPMDPDTASHFSGITRWLDRALLQVNVLSRLMNDLYIARFRREMLTLFTQPTDLTALLARIVEEQHHLFPMRKFDLQLRTTEPVTAVVDPERITQVLINFISNAIKYAPDREPITIRLLRQKQKVRIEIQDRGPGIAPEDQEQIWERSYRVKGVKAHHKAGANLGMGLYICRLIIQQHHGSYGVESAPGQGSTFWFTLPLTPKS